MSTYIELAEIEITSRYNDALMSANTAADFNKEFKVQLDAGMYNHVIQPRSASSVEELPMGLLDDAEAVLTRLEKITTLPDNRWRIHSMLDMCATLRGYMLQIAREPSYDERVALLERNIRGETGLTPPYLECHRWPGRRRRFIEGKNKGHQTVSFVFVFGDRNR